MRKIQHTLRTRASRQLRAGFTLMETVIAIGVLAVLLTGFLAVFTPAVQGIRRSIDAQQADRLASTLEQELVTLRSGEEELPNITTGFDKAFDWIINGDDPSQAILVYQYRGSTSSMRDDGTPEPQVAIDGQPGDTYTVQTMARRLDDPLFYDDNDGDIKAIEGRIFFVKPEQLVFTGGQLTTDGAGKLQFLDSGGSLVEVTASDDYLDAVIAFSAEFHSVPSKSRAYLQGSSFETLFQNAKNPVFTRNLAVRR
ncbi:MAG: prepilin-type N-terminal cleavage/methylation domain-containing protein [Akkermansiaceae bacterium]|jgi:prepilin-type N-terminal cleavage/methylation domain-containing protein|nr:prepilin-type N-terminal cleavage/methylation domain-containing protein [Akkermansiaceae bacterium]MDP4645930.1 prepilin-type N-terminal cleavage/methylation domain-containing protein [Akkermansiaceae bacterium]MDP4722404.1 prepilin-type N-terminal cleavage/methylation domain-containing protein [Akkermansiaceae bacterium]MDP4898496.1 prepilin-type N-terminal cleavage/methylation domain-containing protein [Akkermansiaceae bacterium]MDP4995193.1 prepilin-type N-terminal cleavage/methylation do